jgi:2-oxoisovalerate dehydrogenase E2 component (dihydrolipoyl transacylase)
MGTYVVRLPDVGEGIAEAEVIEWLVGVGDEVREGDPVVEVMTDKASVELPSPASGTVEWLGASVGELVAVGSDLLRLSAADGAAPDDAGAAPRTEAGPLPRDDAGAAPPPQTAARSITAGQDNARRPLAAPAVRRRAANLGIDLATVGGTGPDGAIRHEDLDRLIFGDLGEATVSGMAIYTIDGGGFGPRSHGPRREPLTGLRRSIAEHLEQAWEQIPHFTYVEEVDVEELLHLRHQLASSRNGEQDAPSPGTLALILRAVIIALRDHPGLNTTFDPGTREVVHHRAVDLGLAVQTPRGLVVPVVRDAGRLDVTELAAETERLAGQARAGTLTRAELSGSTVTVSSLGALGGVAATPIVNHPEVAIIGINRIVERPVVHRGAIVVRHRMNLSSSFDHRVVDGWDAARFVQRVKTLLETPALLFMQ